MSGDFPNELVLGAYRQGTIWKFLNPERSSDSLSSCEPPLKSFFGELRVEKGLRAARYLSSNSGIRGSLLPLLRLELCSPPWCLACTWCLSSPKAAAHLRPPLLPSLLSATAVGIIRVSARGRDVIPPQCLPVI